MPTKNLEELIGELGSAIEAAGAMDRAKGPFAELKARCLELVARLKRRDDTLEETLAELTAANERLAQELQLSEDRASAKSREFRAMFQGESIAVKALRESVAHYSSTDEPLLLTGPRGAGEEAVASAIHYGSPRRTRPFVFIDCARFNADQESSLFGSDSWETPDGRAYLADKGTLYMSQVERLPKTAQWALREYLETAGKAREKGETPVPDLRIIIHTRQDLPALAATGKLDPPLAQLLGRATLSVPALSERREDILPMAEQLLKAGARFYGKVVEGFDEAARKRLTEYGWPGNVDELDAVIRQSVIVTINTTIEEMDLKMLGARRLGDYRLIDKLGEGGMGEVWLARHEGLGSTAAVKLIRSDLTERKGTDPEEAFTRFEREAKATAMLRSPHTVRLFDFGPTPDGGLYYVMEYLEGRDLDEMVVKEGPLTPARMVHYLRGAAYSLAEAHGAGLVHRDIKPGNIFSCRLGLQRDFPKLIDFGIARRMEESGPRITAAHVFPGTPEFSAPETVTNPEIVGPASDLYSLGCTAFFLVTGETPFDGKGDFAVMMKHVNEPPPLPSDRRPGLPGWVDRLILDLMAKKPEDRPPSAADLIDRLNRDAGG